MLFYVLIIGGSLQVTKSKPLVREVKKRLLLLGDML